MELYTESVNHIPLKACSSDGVLKLSDIRKSSLPYLFAWVIIFTVLYFNFLPNGNLIFLNGMSIGGQRYITTYIWLITCPAIAFLSKAEHYVPSTIYSTSLAVICFLAALLVKAPLALNILSLITAAAVGHIFASAGYGFFMVLNNAEKFYSMIIGIILPKLLLLILPMLNITEYINTILLLCLAALLICSVFFCKEKSALPILENKKTPKKAYSLMAVVFIVLAFNDVIAPITMFTIKSGTKAPVHLWYLLGIFIGTAVIILLQKLLQLNICIMLNISMAFLAVGFSVCSTAISYPLAIGSACVCFGIAYVIGMVNIYYLAGFMAKKLQSITFYRIGIILSAVYYFYGFGTARLFHYNLSIISLVSVCIVILFFTLLPVFIRMLYCKEWMDDCYRQDVTYENRLCAKLAELKLSAKEIKVCRLLLQGCTLRQAAANLGIAYPTVNTYCTSLYRKLNINSRTELTIMFKEYLD